MMKNMARQKPTIKMAAVCLLGLILIIAWMLRGPNQNQILKSKLDVFINHKINKKKINSKGEYLPFYGYTIIAKCRENQGLEKLKDFIQTSSLRMYFSPLPVSSYHMTIYDVWSVSKRPVIAPVQKWMDEHGITKIDNSKLLPPDAMRETLQRAQKLAQEMLPKSIKVRPKMDPYGRPIRILESMLVEIMEEKDQKMVDKFRDTCSEIFGHKDERLIGRLHITLVYQYRKVPPQEIDAISNDLQKLEDLAMKLFPIELDQGDLVTFNDMTEFTTYRL
ncbi:unnamed protein product [Owenia fusiformis]|uniref:Uncharacterized protein n=1 Tax=Owenia fusiformis TaxID=6347 RepID=A0A8J1TQQ6_OWEFU|nr:unnamed protein product [Owenia fusiformis]